MALDEGREILKLRDDELEELIKKWIAHEVPAYYDFDRNSGAGDRGLDSVGFLSDQRYEGAWDNYQCKQLSKALGEPSFFGELGKVLYYASLGEFTLPSRYIFVAPFGVVGNVRNWLAMPTKLKSELRDNWTARCAKLIVAKTIIPMSNELLNCIESFDFSKVEAWNVHKLVEQPNLRKVLHQYVDIDPGTAPPGVVPSGVDQSERPYIAQLIGVYEDHGSKGFADELEVFAHPDYGPHLQDQRRRYHDADAFNRHFRDNITEDVLLQFEQDIYDGVVDEYRSEVGYKRVSSVMKLAGQLQVSGVFERHKRAPVSVKQGVCHHFANKERLPWKK